MHSSPVCHFTTPKSLSFDLHVLGAPPAFVLSQDQTLKSYFIFKGRHFNTLVVLFLFDSYSIFKDRPLEANRDYSQQGICCQFIYPQKEKILCSF